MSVKSIRTVAFFVAFGLIGYGAYHYRQSASEEVAASGAAGRRGGGGGGGGGGMFGRGGGGGRTSQTITVNLVKAETGAIHERLLLTGALKPKEQVDVMPKSTGRLEAIHFNVGDTVKVGDMIAELESDELQQQVRRAEASISVSRASLSQRKAELANSEAQMNRSEQLKGDGLISSQDYDAQKTATEVVRAQVNLAEAQLQQTEAELRELGIRLEQTKIYASINGQVATRSADVGALLGPNTPIVRLVNLNTMVTAANVPEREVGKLRIGNQAIVHVDAFGDRDFTGRVARISPVLDAATRSAAIEIEISNPGGLLRAEMFARVELDLSTMRQAVLIPREALVYRGQQAGVYLMKNDRPEFRALEIGLNQGDKVEVLANLASGTVVIGKGSSMLTEGDRVRVAGDEPPAPGAGRGAPGSAPSDS